MGCEIYYFSGTGNTLTVARDLAKQVNANLIPILKYRKADIIHSDKECFGIAFPVYEGGLPGLVREFISKLNNISEKYIFAISTCRITNGCTVETLRNLIGKQRGHLSASFSVIMPNNHIPAYKDYVSTEQEKEKMYRVWREERLPWIADYINSRLYGVYEKLIADEDPVGEYFISKPFFNRILLKLNKRRDSNFYVNSRCNGCGICEKVCPVDNIEMKEGKPHFLHHCEQCLSCLQWCPQEAMQYHIHFPFYKKGDPFNNRTESRPRYHHPEVKVKHIIRQKG